MTKYIIAGKTETVISFIKERSAAYVSEEGRKMVGEKLVHCRTKKDIYRLKENDTIILLQGWWGRSWAKEAIKDAVMNYPQIEFEYFDGKFGESERKTLRSGKIHGRYEILDFSRD